MNYICNPLNLPYKYQLNDQNGTVIASREAADPSMVLFNDLYYLFPSMTAGFYTSTDLVNWEFHTFNNKMPVYDYAPDIRVIGDYLYFSASKREANCSFYRTKDPLEGTFEEIEGTFPFWDPNLFVDDDGRIYFYWGCSNITPIYGVELDPETMRPLTDPRELIFAKTDEIGYERFGEDHVAPKTPEMIEAAMEAMIARIPNVTSIDQLPEEMQLMLRKYAGNDPYVEGAWMDKYNGLYYLQYSVPGTQYNVYGDAVYIGKSPLGPFRLARNNPYSYKPGGFITGAGHGSTMEDKNGRWWHTSTMRISISHQFERRLGLWKAGFDADGDLYCDQRYGDWPMRMEQKAWEKPEWMLLSYGKAVSVSSGTGSEHVTDEDIRTWWSAATSQPGEWVEIDLGQCYDIRAIQVNFADDNLLVPLPDNADLKGETMDRRLIDEIHQKTRWKLEGSVDGRAYTVIEDKTKADTDLPHDFIVREAGIEYRYIRLTVEELPYGQKANVSGIRIFGHGSGELPKAPTNVKVERISDLDAVISWQKENALGYNILWGYSPDKLYHSCMVFGKQEQKIGALVKGEPVYFRVDAFNENGITEGEVIN